MPFRETWVDVGSESPREDYPWRPVKVKDPYDTLDDNTIYINPASCLMTGMDVMAKYPVAGLGLPFKVSELDFVWLVTYFDSNMRPIHAGVCKGPRWTRWYEYGGVSWGGWPRCIKTMRRDQIGSGIGGPDKSGMVIPEVPGPEMNFINYEVQKEIEFISRNGILYGGQYNYDKMVGALKTELTMFLYDPVQVKQWAAFSLLGYCTSKKPDAKYPFPFVELHKTIDDGTTGSDKAKMKYYYRQAASTHLMLQEMSMGGVRCCQLVPSFAPYMETMPHPKIEASGGGIKVTVVDGTVGTLPSAVVGHTNYIGSQKAIGTNLSASECPHVQIQLPDPGENSQVMGSTVGVIGSKNGRIVWQKQGGSGDFLGRREVILPDHSAGDTFASHTFSMANCDSIKIYTQGNGCLDSQVCTVTSDKGGKLTYTSDEQTTAIPMN